MSTLTDSVDHYIAAWNDTDPTSRLYKVSSLWADDGTFVDPLVEAKGHEAIAATIGGVQAQFPDYALRLTGTPDGHHNFVRFTWELGPQGGPAPIAGFDVAVLGEDGRISAVHGFFDRLPS